MTSETIQAVIIMSKQFVDKLQGSKINFLSFGKPMHWYPYCISVLNKKRVPFIADWERQRKTITCQNRNIRMSPREHDLSLVTLTICASYIGLDVSVVPDLYSGQCCLQDVREHGYSQSFIIRGALTWAATSAPISSSTIVRPNSKLVPGPRLVM